MIPILLVDDEPALLEIAKIFIEREEGLQVTTCSSAFEALKILENERFSVIIADYEMPAMDGIEFLKKIRAAGNSTPFIIFTGRGREQVVIEAINYGADFYLQKGGDPKSQFAELRNMIQQAVKRKDAEEAFSRSERQLYEIINFLPDATFAIDREGKVIAWNRAIEEMTGIPASVMLGKGDMEYAIPFYGTRRKILIDLLFEKDESLIGNYYKHIVRNGHGIIAETEISLLTKTPTIIWAKATPFYDESHNVIGAVESIRDITDLRQYQETIIEGKNKFQELTDQLPQSIFEIDLLGNILYANQRTFEIFRYPRDKGYAGYTIFQMLVPEEHERARQGIIAAVKGIGVQGDVYTALRGDGTTFPIRIFCSPIFRDTTITGIRGTIVDLTEIEAAEGRARENEDLFASFVENLPDGIALVDLEGNILFVNQAAADMTGFSSGELCIGKNIREILLPGYKDTVTSHLLKIKEGVPILAEYQICTESGEVRWIEVRGRMTVFRGRTAAVLTARDITHRREEEDTRRVQTENRIRYHEALLDIAKSDLSNLFTAVRQMIRTDASVLGVERVSYWEYDNERKAIVCRDLYRSSSGTYESGTRLEAGRYPSYFKALNERRLIVYDDVRDQPCTTELYEDYLEPAGITSMIDVPVWYNGQVIGILCHEHTGPARSWTDSEREFATSVADHISLAIETSKRHEIEVSLKESEATSRALINATHDIALLITPDGIVLDANIIAAERLGTTIQDLAGKYIYDLFPEGPRKMRKEWAEKAIETGKIVQFDDEGAGRILESTVYPVRDTAGTINRLAIFSHDITDQKRNAALLEERERFFNNIFSSIRDGISIIDPDMRIVRVNPVMEEWYAHQMPIIGKRCYEVYQSRNERCEQCPSMVTLTTHSDSFEVMQKRGKDGIVTGWLELYTFPLIDSRTGRMTGVIEYFRDISQRKEALEALRESEERLKVAIDGGDICTWEYDVPAGSTVRVNEKWTDIFGYHPEDLKLTLDEWTALSHPDDLLAALGPLKDLIEGKIKNLEVEARLKCSNGTYKWILIRGKPISFDEQGKPGRIAGTIQDISDMRKYRDIIEVANRKLHLLNNITRHDLKNQLTVLNGALELAKTGSTDEISDYIAMAEKAAAAMTRMIAFTKEYQDIGVREPIWQSVAAMAGRAANSLQSDRITIDIHVGKIRIFADRLLEKVFYNLFDNALRHGGAMLTTIQVLAREEGSGLIITVEDDGIGITRRDKERIFERGFGQNTGLGLFLAREILSITGITIHETGLPGKGAKFEIHVPKDGYGSLYCEIKGTGNR